MESTSNGGDSKRKLLVIDLLREVVLSRVALAKRFTDVACVLRLLQVIVVVCKATQVLCPNHKIDVVGSVCFFAVSEIIRFFWIVR